MEDDGLTVPPRVTGAIRNQQSNIDALTGEFPRYLQIFDPPFRRYGQWEYHAETIKRRRELGSASKAIYDDQFLDALYRTLQAWGIGIRASKLKNFQGFVAALRAKSSEIVALDGKVIDDPNLDVSEIGQQLWRLSDSLDIVTNNTRIVAGSKTLHHLLPELVVPIDRAYTQRFFCWQSPTFQYEQRACFEQAFASFAQIARRTHPSQYVNSGWNSSRTKIIDNAIVGLISDQQGAEKKGVFKARQNPNIVTGNHSTVQASKSSFSITSIVKWFRTLLAGQQQT